MPPIPTIQNGSENDRAIRPQDRKSDIICRVKYSNTLPDIPFDLKFLTVPFDSERFTKYNPTTLERNYKFEVLTEHDLGVTIDLINRDLYQPDRNSMHLDPADEKLLEEDTHTPQDTTRSRHHAKSVSWLRKSEYISTEQTRFQPQNMEKAEAKVGYNVKNYSEETLYMDRDQQIRSIEATFNESKKEITHHYCKPNVRPVEIFDIYPDFKNWKFPFAQVMFDADPSPSGKSLTNQIEEMSQAMIRGVMDESGEQFVAYFLPTEETLEKRRIDFSMERPYEDETEYEYKMAREYNWNVKSKMSKGYEENYFLIIREDGVFFNELETRVRLSKRRQKAGVPSSNTKLVVRHRPLNAAEHKMQTMRERQLEPPGEEEEISGDDEMEEERIENTDKKTDKSKNDKEQRQSRSRSVSRSKSRSRSRSGSRSKSGSGSGSGSERNSRSRSRSGSHSSGSRSRSRSAHSNRSGSNCSGSAKSRSRSGSANSRRSGSNHSGSHRSSHSSRRSSRSGSHSSNSGSGSD